MSYYISVGIPVNTEIRARRSCQKRIELVFLRNRGENDLIAVPGNLYLRSLEAEFLRNTYDLRLSAVFDFYNFHTHLLNSLWKQYTAEKGKVKRENVFRAKKIPGGRIRRGKPRGDQGTSAGGSLKEVEDQAFRAFWMSAVKESALRAAPPMRPPSMSCLETRAPEFSAFMLPPYWTTMSWALLP